MHEKEYEQWLPVAVALTEEPSVNLGTPRNVYLREAMLTAGEGDNYWDPADPSLPRFYEKDNPDPKLKKSTIEEVPSLRRAILEAIHRHQMIIDPVRPQGLVDKGIYIARELITALKYAHDDGIFELADQQLERLIEEYPSSKNDIASLSAKLYAFGAFANKQRVKLEALGEDFDINLITEAIELSEQLAKLPPGPATPSIESQAALSRRDRLISLLVERVDLIRKVARWKYRDHPEIIQKFTSSYERRRNAATKRKQANDKHTA